MPRAALNFHGIKFTKFVCRPGTFKIVNKNSCNISHTLTTRADEFPVVVLLKGLQFFVDLPHVICLIYYKIFIPRQNYHFLSVEHSSLNMLVLD